MTIRPTQKYFGAEKVRNQDNATLFTRLIHRAFGDCYVIVGHHVLYQFGTDVTTEDEIPSADTVLFDHDIMGACFGAAALPLMAHIATLRPGDRETAVTGALDALEEGERA